MRARLPSLVVVLLAAVAAPSWGACLRSSRGDAQGPTPSSDVAALGKLIRLPPGVLAARWLTRPVRPPGSRLVPGPTDFVLAAYLTLPPGAWSSASPALRPLAPVTREIAAADARALLPPALFASLPAHGTKVELAGLALDPTPLDASLYHPSAALRIGDAIYASFRTQ
jgi:hypothetical protein